jgi:hypothetical protein
MPEQNYPELFEGKRGNPRRAIISASGLYKLLLLLSKTRGRSVPRLDYSRSPSLDPQDWLLALPKYFLCHTVYHCSFMAFGQMRITFGHVKLSVAKKFTDVEKASTVHR